MLLCNKSNSVLLFPAVVLMLVVICQHNIEATRNRRAAVDSELEDRWEEFKQRFEKKYSSLAEENHRLSQMLQKLIYYWLSICVRVFIVSR